VDISKEVFSLADFYSGDGYSNPLRDPRVTAFVQDGRFFLQASPQRYDIITGEPPPLKVAGTVNLYTQQFFALMNDRLKDDGIATFWLPIYQLTTDDPKTRSDLERIGIEVPEQMSSLFLIDGDEIDRITQGVEPLSDFYPKRLTDMRPNLETAFRFGYNYLERSAARRHFLSSALIDKVWPNEWKDSLELFFLVRETQFLSEISGSNW